MYDAARKDEDKEQIRRGKMDGADAGRRNESVYSPRSNRSYKV
jgi:hypothetical protein